MQLSLEEINWCLDEPGNRRSRTVQDEAEMMLPGTIAANAKCPDALGALLLNGVSKELLHEYISGWKQITAEAEIDTMRMNIIAGLRSCGYIIEGGRQNRSLPYKVVGWSAPREKQDVSVWGGGAYDWVKSLEKVEASHASRVRGLMASPLSCDKRPIHERSWMYLWSYELARDTGYWFRDELGRGHAIVIQKHQNYPRYRIFNLTLNAEALAGLASTLAPISMSPVKALCVSPEAAKELKVIDNKGYVGRRREAVYRVERIATQWESILSRRGREMFRAAERQGRWEEAKQQYHVKTVIDYWKEANEKKHRQLAITRDYQALEAGWDDPDCLIFCGYRDGEHPSCIHILDPVARSHGVGQIAEKSLNYSSIVGGKPGTADWNLIKTCQWLHTHEIEFINAGGYDGGGYGLPAHKAVFALPEDDIDSISFDFSFPHVRKEDIEI